MPARRPSPPVLGVLEWFRPGEHERVERVLDILRTLGLSHLRTGFSWADFHTPEGEAWYDWFIPRLAREVEVLPCFTYTPPSIGIEPKTSAPPKNPKDYADFLDQMITRLGEHFEWVELWNEPNNLNDWDWRLDPNWEIFCSMVDGAANWCQQRGKKTVLGGMCPTDPNWLDLLCRRDALRHMDAVGLHGFPGTWEHDWETWDEPLEGVRRVLDWHGVDAEVWITEAGFSTWQHDEFEQLRAFAQLAEVSADRAYWYAAQDLHPHLPHQDGFHKDERHYHFGLTHSNGRPKLLHRVLAEQGLDGVRALAETIEQHAPAALVREGRALMHNRKPRASDGHGMDGVSDGHTAGKDASAVRHRSRAYTLITGGAGFIGSNVAHRLLTAGRTVRIFDSLARPGVEKNLQWLIDTHGSRVQVDAQDIRNPYALAEAVRGADQVFHFAAQVAVTTSIAEPRMDYEVNLQGTMNLLEALRALDAPPPVLFTSTNKVYGTLRDLGLTLRDDRYEPADDQYRTHGISEAYPLDFHSPYGCSKGAADQYVLDYARMYDLPAVVFRMSCIYGPRQLGTEDQGWVAHFLIRALSGESITLYGDGKQVRDVLFVDDLVDAMLLAHEHMDDVRGHAFNIGGGPANAVSLRDVLDRVAVLQGERPATHFDDWRPGDQRYFTADTRAFQKATGWSPLVGVHDGIERLYDWLLQTHSDVSAKLVA